MSTTLFDDPAAQLGSSLLSDLVRALGFHRWLIMAVALGTMLTTYGAFQFVSDQYQTTARLLVKLGRENVELPVTVDKGALMSTGVRREEINSEIQLIGSQPLLEAAVDAIGLDAFKLEPPPPVTWFQRVKRQLRAVAQWVRGQIKETMIALNLRPRLTEREEAVLLLSKTLVVEREKDSDVISITIRLPSSDLAVRIVDTVVKLYLERRLDVRREHGMSDFFDEQLRNLRGQLSVLDASKQSLRSKGNVSAVGEERALLMNRLQQLYGDIANDQRELNLLTPGGIAKAAPPRAKASEPSPVPVAADMSAATVPAALSSYPNLEQLRSKVTELRLRRTDLLQQFNEGAESVMRVDREIGQIEGTLRQAIAAQLGERQAVAQAIEHRLLSLNASEVSLEVIERDRAVLNQNYQSYAKRREEARVSEALDLRRVSNIAILNAAERPIEPVGPRKLLIVGLALPFGLLAGLGIALFLEYLNQTIRDERDLTGADKALFLGPLRVGGRGS